MLVLSRKLGESISIGGEIELQVLGIHGGRIQLGLNCPHDIRILRSELLPSHNRSKHEPTAVPDVDLPSAAG